MTKEQKDYLKRLRAFFKWTPEKGEIDERESNKAQLADELRESDY